MRVSTPPPLEGRIRVSFTFSGKAKIDQGSDYSYLLHLLHEPEKEDFQYYYNNAPKYVKNAYAVINERESKVRKMVQDAFHCAMAEFIYLYIDGRISIVADKKLFGREAGEELADLFLLNNPCPISFISPSFEPIRHETSITQNDYYNPDSYPVTEYLTDGVMLERHIWLSSAVAPEELKEYGITLTFSFPVKEERYYDYCLASAKKENTELEFVESIIKLSVYYPSE